MKTTLRLTLGLLLLATCNPCAAVLFVSQVSTNPTPPYDTWATAATNIQDAVNAAPSGALVLVSNGVYAGGLVVDRPLQVMSYSGAQLTIIDGRGTNRCVWMTNNVRLYGFTVTNGWATDGGGVWCSSSNAYVTNCVIAGNSVSDYGGGAWGGTLGRCILSGNTAGTGGGAASATLDNCILTNNSAIAYGGGGAFQCALINCLLTANMGNAGGGAFGGTLNNCTLSGNQASFGGGAQAAELDNCIVYFNTAPSGANANSCTLNYSCTRPLPGAGTGNIDLDPQFVNPALGNFRLQSTSPCINAGNNALVLDTWLDLDRNLRIVGGTVDMGAYEFPSPSIPTIVLQPVSQTVPSGTDVQFTAAADGATPLFWQWCFNGTAISGATTTILTLTAVTTNQAGNYTAVVTNSFGSATSQVAVLIVGDSAPLITQQPVSQVVAPGAYITLTVGATGSLPMFWQWQFNGIPIADATNSSLNLGPITVDLAGNYSVVVSNAFGSVTSADATVSLSQATVSYVWTNSPTPTPPYTNWATAAHTIQQAINAAGQGSQIVVTNGVYAGGLSVGKSLALLSVNGPQFTTIDANYALVPCVSLTDGTSLSGFTVTHGYGYYGGGLWCASTNVFVTNCVMVNNRAQQTGGGSYGGTLYSCTLAGNTATNFSGGAYGSTLVNCVISTNIAGGLNACILFNCTISGHTLYGGGAVNSTLYNCVLTGNGSDYFYWDSGAAYSTLYNCTLSGNRFGARHATLYNCVVYYSTGSGGTNYDADTTLNYSCSTPMPTTGVGNITNEPLFVNLAGGDLHLQTNSPCINAGNNAYVTTPTDLDGNPRIVSSTVDIGAYEFQGFGSTISYAWLQKYGLPTDCSADLVDTDNDGMNNWQEWVCGTDPTNPLSVLRLSSAALAGNNITVIWQSVAGVNYFLKRSADLGAWFSLPPTNALLATNIALVATNIAGQAGTTTFTDTNATPAGPLFYRVGVQHP